MHVSIRIICFLNTSMQNIVRKVTIDCQKSDNQEVLIFDHKSYKFESKSQEEFKKSRDY